MQDTFVRPVTGTAPITPPAKPDLARSDPDKAETARVETGMGAWASAFAGDDNAQAAIALAEAINRARNSQTNREHRAADARVIAVSRLETLRARLAPVYAAIPRDVELFDLGMVGHTPPRLFVDIIAFVEMTEDKRSFRLVQETRSGRVVLGEAADERQMTALVTNYIAERLVERERALAAQGVHARPMPLPKAVVTPDTSVAQGLQRPPESVSAAAPLGEVDAAIRDMAASATTAMAAPALPSAPAPVGAAPVTPDETLRTTAAATASSAGQAVVQGLRAAPVAAAAAAATVGAAGAATLRQAEPGRSGGSGWFWPLLALLIGIGVGALALYLYAASLSRP